MGKNVLLACLIAGFSGRAPARVPAAPDPGSRGTFRAMLLPREAEAPEKAEGPSPGRAFLYSLVLPGAGQIYAGSGKMAQIFLGSEGLLWATFLTFRAYGHSKQSDYRNYAAVHAGITNAGKDYDYYVAIENYNDIRAYNEAKLQQRAVDEMYPEDAIHSWEWDSEASREAYERMRISSDRAFRRSLFVVGGIVVNHLVSGIDAVRLARKAKRSPDSVTHLGVYARPEGGFEVALWRSW